MNEMLIVSSIINSNKQNIDKILEIVTPENIICRYFTIEIVINFFNLCEEYPEIVNTAVRNILFNNLLSDQIDLYIEGYLTKLNYENTSIIRKKVLYQLQIKHILPIQLFQQDLRKVYQLSKTTNFPVLKMNTEGNLIPQNNLYSKNKQIPLTNYHILLLYGKINKIRESLTIRSSYLVCENKLCQDKSHILKLKGINYLIKESKKSFFHLVDDKQDTCINCKSFLVENIKYRSHTMDYEYFLTDQNQTIFVKSQLDLSNEGFFLGTLERRTNGKLVFNVLQFYTLFTESIKYEIWNLSRDLTSNLLAVSSFVFRPVKSNCDIQDCLLFIILNIFSNNDNIRMLLFTTDPCYVRKCALNLFKVKDVNCKIYYDMKSFKNYNGLCIREYGDIKFTNIDLIFHIPINHLLDYSYKFTDLDYEIHRNIKSLLESDHKNIQELFIKFRKEYKRIIEPERLLNTLTNIYISIYEFTECAYQINSFILKHFVDKLL